MDLPPLGLGTYDLVGSTCTKIVREALNIGYRHFDTAHVYDNHRAIGKGIQGFDRSKLFLTSKIHLNQIDSKKIGSSVEKACNLALKELATDYLDLYLIHWPDFNQPLAEIFKAMEQLAQKGKIRHAGVSNFTIHHLEDLLREKKHPFANQVEFHPYLYQKDLLDYCKAHHIRLIAYRPLGKGNLLKEPLLQEIGSRYKKTAAQVILRWLTEHHIATIPRTGCLEHLKENFEIFDFKLSAEEMGQIDRLHRNQRFCKPDNPVFNY